MEHVTRTHSSFAEEDVTLEQCMVFRTAMSDPPPLDFLLVSVDLSCLNTLKPARFSNSITDIRCEVLVGFINTKVKFRKHQSRPTSFKYMVGLGLINVIDQIFLDFTRLFETKI